MNYEDENEGTSFIVLETETENENIGETSSSYSETENLTEIIGIQNDILNEMSIKLDNLNNVTTIMYLLIAILVFVVLGRK